MSLRVSNVKFGYTKKQLTLKAVSLEAKQGALIGIAGPNGCGKTTFIKCINRILHAHEGSAELSGLNLWALPRPILARCVAYVPQFTGAVMAGTVLDMLILGRKPYIAWWLSNNDVDLAFAVLQKLGMEQWAGKKFSELSGGQKQKVLIGRALVQNPDVYLLDEPTSALDIKNQIEIMKIIRELVRVEGKTVIMVMHDLNMAMRNSDYVMLMRDGMRIAFGTPGEVLTADHIREVWGLDVKIVDGNYIIPE